MSAGGLHLGEGDTAPREALMAAWLDLFGVDPPPQISRRLMRLMIAGEIQWKASGRSRVALTRRLEKLAADVPVPAKPRIKPGTRLVREWHGRKHVVDVTRSVPLPGRLPARGGRDLASSGCGHEPGALRDLHPQIV